jgi:hypothetical protein
MDSYKSSSFLKCIACGVTIFFLGAELVPSIYQALCDQCQGHAGHLPKHTHEEGHRPFNPDSGERTIMVGTATTSTGALSGYFL